MTKDMINNGVNSDDKSRIIQEYVPGKQITLAHMVTRPKASVYKKLGLPDDYHDAIGILTITPSEATITMNVKDWTDYTQEVTVK